MSASIRPQHPFEPDPFLVEIHSRRAAGEDHIARALPASAALLAASLALFGLVSPAVRPAAPPDEIRSFEFTLPPQLVPPQIERNVASPPRSPAAPATPARFVPDALAPEPAIEPMSSPSARGLEREGGAVDPGPAMASAIDRSEGLDADPSRPSAVWHEVMPAAVHVERPLYPDLARDAHVEGTVQVWVLVGRDGRVEQVRVHRSVPMLDEAAVEAVRRWRFTPARAGEQPVRAWVSIPVRFRLHD